MLVVCNNMQWIPAVKGQWVYDSLTDPVLDGAPWTPPGNCKKECCLLKFSDVFKRQMYRLEICRFTRQYFIPHHSDRLFNQTLAWILTEAGGLPSVRNAGKTQSYKYTFTTDQLNGLRVWDISKIDVVRADKTRATLWCCFISVN